MARSRRWRSKVVSSRLEPSAERAAPLASEARWLCRSEARLCRVERAQRLGLGSAARGWPGAVAGRCPDLRASPERPLVLRTRSSARFTPRAWEIVDVFKYPIQCG